LIDKRYGPRLPGVAIGDGMGAGLMRTLGPGSVASLLKTVLDLAYYGLIIGEVILALVFFAMFLAHPDGAMVNVNQLQGLEGKVRAMLARPWVMPVMALMINIATIGYILILKRLRQVFATLAIGDPFHPDNVVRLRYIGAILVGLELLGYLFSAYFWVLDPTLLRDEKPSISLSGWFSILVVFVLAEVFREGARLRREAELTI
jgi:hypothetical protein